MVGALSRRSMSQRLSLLLVVVGLVWGLMLLRYTVHQPRHESSQQLRQQILELSHRYVRVLREEKERAPGGPQGTALAGYADLKRTIAVLLDDILNRLSKLEGKIHLMDNSSSSSSSSSTNSSQPAGGALSAAPVSLQRPGKHKPTARTTRLHPHAPNRL
ncbi:coiled-coil domain-containing protein 126 [Boleophthalmus pectinirostris]|uniref:coiled-coil domain-containing protein 126 n=1 Tax=Boleophthalmus pectinirostris TaxID=150288 RepID=UPI002431E856|nr:coiled-coil domain-containing protein 126 [Boleophthalmus pectinirostris]XP_055013235.1 coiled-coil domain-containing protein 126 [Boleophthalmus pectinirostris]XP_055013236.1 coiled-coil domain-containing protein 126 [Boleophthalmus pectinirostris]